MARFAADAHGIGPDGHETRVIGGHEALGDFFMALFAFRGADVFRPRHIGQHHRLTRNGTAGNHHQQQDTRDGDQGHPALPPAEEPELVEE